MAFLGCSARSGCLPACGCRCVLPGAPVHLSLSLGLWCFLLGDVPKTDHFRLATAGVTFLLPDGRDVGSEQGHRPKNRYFQVSSLRTLAWSSSSGSSRSFSSSLFLFLLWKEPIAAGFQVVSICAGDVILPTLRPGRMRRVWCGLSGVVRPSSISGVMQRRHYERN